MNTVKNCSILFFKQNFVRNQILSPTLAGAYVRNFSIQPIEYDKTRDPAPFFFSKRVQNILKKLTRPDFEKVFRHRKLGEEKIETPIYRFMTDEDLKKAQLEAADKANEILQMPPVIQVRDEIECVLSRDPALQGYDSADYVFTDITYGVSDRERTVVIRHADGILRKANWSTRQRMNQLYFPQSGRELKIPLMFEDSYLESLFKRKEYEFILDRACIQFEPDDPNYQRVTSQTYQYLNEYNDFQMLRSTRHFGPLVFFLVWFKNIDNLLLELIETSYISDANSLIVLYNHLQEKHVDEPQLEYDTKLVEAYIAKNSLKKGQLELALESYKECIKQKQSLERGVKMAHGRL